MKQLLTFLLGSILLFTAWSKDAPTSSTQFTLGSSPGNCTGAVIAGKYAPGLALTSANTMTVTVNVTVAGDYSVKTNTVNGISFSGGGTFTVTGSQNVILAGTGTPLAAGSYNYDISGGGGTCQVSVVTKLPGVITCNLNGIPYDFSLNAKASLVYNAGINLKVYGRQVPSASTGFEVWIQHPTIKPLTTGTYHVNMSGFYVKGQYTDAVYNYWMGVTKTTTQTNPFTVVITKVSATEVEGTFSGKIIEKAATGPGYKTVTEGYFHVAF